MHFHRRGMHFHGMCMRFRMFACILPVIAGIFMGSAMFVHCSHVQVRMVCQLLHDSDLFIFVLLFKERGMSL